MRARLQRVLALALMLALAALARGAGAQAPDPDQPPPLRFTVTGFEVTGENPIPADETAALLRPFIGDYEGVEGLFEAATTLERALAEREYSFHRVVLPAQTLKKGTVVLEVVAFKIGEILVEGNEHFSRENILRSMPGLVPGDAPRTARLSHQRYIANQHPSKKVELRFKESQKQRAIDAHLDVQDSDPHDLFVGVNNTGNNATGDFRATFGFQHSNLTDRDDQLTVTATASPTKVSKVEQLGGSYALPLYALGGRFNAYVATSDVESGLVADVFDVSGAGRFLGASYTHFLQRRGSYTHSLTVGVDDKRFDNNVDFGGVPIGVDVRTRPVSLAYNASMEHERGLASFYLSYVRNWPRGRLNSKLNYTANRAGSDPVWDALRFGATADVQVYDEWLLRWRGDGQLTDDPLVSGEQFGAGGARSVRGYEEREVSGDLGFFTSLEAWSPPVWEGLRGIVFGDIAHLRDKKTQVVGGTKTRSTLLSAGVGIRWFWRTNLSLEADLARTFDAGSLSTPGGTKSAAYRAHFNIFYRF